MKKLIYKIEAYSLVGNPETGEDDRRLSPSEVFVNNPSEEDIATAAEIAYNGEYTIEDDGQPEPEAGDSSVWDELEKAYQEGVDSV